MRGTCRPGQRGLRTRRACSRRGGGAGLSSVPAAWAGTQAGDGALIRVQLLGPVRAWRSGCLLHLGPPQQQLLLAMLALNAGKTVPRDDLVDALWERAPDSAVGIVHKHISGLRNVLEPGHRARQTRMLAFVSGGYELRLGPGTVDTAMFARHRQEARSARA